MTEPLQWMGKIIVLTGVAMAAIGGLMMLVGWLSGGTGVPGDLVLRRPGMVVYMPLATALLLSIVVSLVLTLLGALWPRG